MQGQRGRSERHSGVFLDMVHLILGIAIVILAVLSFINLSMAPVTDSTDRTM